MNKQEKQKLIELFKKQQELNIRLFKREFEFFGKTMDYDEERLQLELAIYQTEKSLKDIENFKIEIVSEEEDNKTK